MKRQFDIFCALLGLLVFSPVIIIISLLILLDDGFPIIFQQQRLGKRLAPFNLIKFRSMRNNQVTRVGHYIRATGIDEILQFFNVLAGSMSMVGPRPLTQQDLNRLESYGFAQIRFTLKPGITGLSQLLAGRGAKVSLFLEKKYLQEQSLKLDIKLIGLSFMVNILGKRRVRH